MKRNVLGFTMPATTLALLGLLTLTSLGADSITNFGLTHTPLGQAVVDQDGNTYVSVTTNRGDGVSIFLGESDSGGSFMPWAGDWLEPRDYVHADAYGQLNGATNQLLASARGLYGWYNNEEDEDPSGLEQDGWTWDSVPGQYTAGVDLSPLGGNSLTLVALNGEHVVGVVSNVSRTFGVSNQEWGWGNPLRRVAPLWRMADGSIGALFEFWWPTQFGPFGALGDRYFVRVENPTNTVGFISRLDVISRDLPSPYIPPPTNSGTGLTRFELGDVRLGMFHQQHRAFDWTIFEATNGRLSVILRTNNLPDWPSIPTVAVELGRSTAFGVDFLPIDLSVEDACFTVSGIGDAAGITGSELGTMRIENTNEVLRLSAQFGIAPRFAQIVVLAGGTAVGTNGVSREMAWVTASHMRRVIGAGLLARTLSSMAGFTVRLDGSTTFTTSTGQTFDGDEVRFLASDPAQFVSLETCIISVAGLSSFTITGERSQPFVLPLLSVTRYERDLILSWPDPNEVFELERASLVEIPEEEEAAFFFRPETNGISAFNGFRSRTWPIDDESHEIFRLRHGPPRPPPPVD